MDVLEPRGGRVRVPSLVGEVGLAAGHVVDGDGRGRGG